MQPPRGYDVSLFLESFSDTVSSANPHGMIDLGRAAVDEQYFENFIDFTKNIERAAENSQNAPPKHPKGSSWVVQAALGRVLGDLGVILGLPFPPPADS